nr:MAG TPA: hypothetical protein [Caudoviricetes sp.]
MRSFFKTGNKSGKATRDIIQCGFLLLRFS